MLFDLQYCTELRLEHMQSGQQAVTKIMMSQQIQTSLQNNVNSTLFPTHNPTHFYFDITSDNAPLFNTCSTLVHHMSTHFRTLYEQIILYAVFLTPKKL